jgi:acetylornithine deacetylase/succinyl-diaminopimelate desuccinylase-like protein
MDPTTFIAKEGNTFVHEFLIPFLKIPSISADPSHSDDMDIAAEFLAKRLDKLGFNTKRIELTKSNDLVFAEKIVGKDKPTVLIYGHYDVQPINQPMKWNRKPFAAEIIEDRIYNRGATDDKGQVAAHLLAQQYFDKLPCNIKCIFEGNEEYGTGEFEEFVKKNGELLACDVVIVSDGGTLVEGHPAISVGLRGIVVIELRTKNAHELVRYISSIHDPMKNKILIPGFYDKIRERHADEAVAQLVHDHDLGVVRPEEGYSQLTHRWFRPSFSPLHLSYSDKYVGEVIKLTVHGPPTTLHSGRFGGPVVEPGLLLCHLLAHYSGKIHAVDYGSSTLSTAIAPQATALLSEKFDVGAKLKELGLDVKVSFESLEKNSKTLHAKAYLSFRLVAGQDPMKIFSVLPHASLKLLEATPAFSADPEDPYVHAVVRGLEMGYGKKPVHSIASGGSIPIVSTIAKTCNAPVALAGFSTPTDGLHGPNESFRIAGGLFVGAKSIIYMLQEIGKLRL